MNLRTSVSFLLFVSSLFLTPSNAPAQTLDQYGGYTGIAVPGGATGYFRVTKVNNRWVFVTPDGNAFWMRAVYYTGYTSDGGTTYQEAIKAKYPNGSGGLDSWTFGTQSIRRLKAWGFNALGEGSTRYTLPVGTYGSATGNTERLPFLRNFSVASTSFTNRYRWAANPVKDLISGVKDTVYARGYRGKFPDVYDPSFAQTANMAFQDPPSGNGYSHMFTEPLATCPWLIGITTDDADYLYGFKRTSSTHLGWVAAVTAPTQSSNTTLKVTYPDTQVYTKTALRNFLINRYGTIRALNAAWGSTYTTFESDGGWGVGTGFLDEDGRHGWMGTDFRYLGNAHPKVRADLDDFLGEIAGKYFDVMKNARDAYLPHHLLLGPAPLGQAKAPVLRAAASRLDVMQTNLSVGQLANFQTFFTTIATAFPKPMYIWTSFSAQADSAIRAYPPAMQDFDNATQEARGAAYANFVSALVNFQAPDGTYPFVGLDWWEFTDKVAGGEHTNFGLVSTSDNAYDGREAVIAHGKDPWGYAMGGERANYGDFLGPVRQANVQVYARLFGRAPRPASQTE